MTARCAIPVLFILISFASAQVTNSGAYTLVVTNSIGSVTSAVGTLVVIATVPLPVALNNSNLTWVTDAPIPWYGQTNISHDGFASAQTWSISDTQSVSLRTSLTGPGTLSYWWKVSSEAGADKLAFRYGGNDQAAIAIGDAAMRSIQSSGGCRRHRP